MEHQIIRFKRGMTVFLLSIMASWLILAPVALAGEVSPVRTVDLLDSCGTMTAVNNGAGDQYDPHVSGDLVAYTSLAGSASEIRYFDFASAADQAIDNQGAYDFLSDVSGRVIVFTRVTSGQSAVHALDVNVGGPAVELDPLVGSARHEAAVGGATVAWEDRGLVTGSSEIVAHDLIGATSTRLTADTALDDSPAVAATGDVAAWRKRASFASPGDIYVAVRSGGAWAVSQLTSTADAEANPDTNGTVVVYDANRAGNASGSDIYWQAVAGGAESQLVLDGQQTNPNISLSLVAFECVAPGEFDADLFAYDVSSNTLFRLTDTPTLNERLNDISVGADGLVRVVWSVVESTDENVYAVTYRLPMADSGPDQTVHAGSIVTLDGSASSDPDGEYPLTYSWTLTQRPAGSAAVLVNPETVSASFTSDVHGDYEAKLLVRDACGLESAADRVFISTSNTPPVADAGPDQSVIVLGATVTLDGSQSWDDDGDDLSYAWSLTQRPAGSSASLSDPSAMNPEFTTDVQGTYQAELVVNDGWTDSAPDMVEVSFQNIKPVASAGGNQSVSVGDTVFLDGTGSSDANGDPLTYSWGFVSSPTGSSATINDAASPVANFTPDSAGDYVVSLVVNDGFTDSDPNNAAINATSSQLPCEDVINKLRAAINTINNLEGVEVCYLCYIEGEPIKPTGGIFKNAGMRNTLTNKINAVIGMIEEGNYSDALDKLENDIRAKTDGCANAGAPDKNDWLKDCESQDAVYQLIQEAIDMIRHSCI